MLSRGEGLAERLFEALLEVFTFVNQGDLRPQNKRTWESGVRSDVLSVSRPKFLLGTGAPSISHLTLLCTWEDAHGVSCIEIMPHLNGASSSRSFIVV